MNILIAAALKKRSLAFVAAAALGGCMVGPDFVKPDPPKDQGYLPDALITETASTNVLGGNAQRFVSDLDIPGQWWEVFQSRPLDSLISSAIQANPDVQAAIAALKVTRLNARAQRGAFFPAVGIGGTANQYQSPNSLSPVTNTDASIFSLFTALLSITYTVDVFGGVRRQVESLDALAEAQCFLLEAAYLTLASNVVVAAVTEASLRGQIEATQRIINLQRDTLDLLQRQSGLGQVPGGDVATQQAALAQVEATLPPLQKQLAQQRNLLATLIGRMPSDAPAERFDFASLTLPQNLPVSLPSKLVEQRPDVRAAEANLHSAGAQVGVAVANQLPQISLNLSLGSTALEPYQLFGPGLIASQVGGGFLAPLLDGGTLQARKRAAVAAFEQADAQYRSTVLTAFRNVADTLRALEYDALTLKAQSEAERAAAVSLNIARRRLELGDVGYITVLTAELAYQQAVIALVQAQASRYADTAALFQALGGGWWNRDPGASPIQRAVCKAPPDAAPRKTVALSAAR
jgi:NodT family efflux transporter outer membrane factor (OMF) lipoprotein